MPCPACPSCPAPPEQALADAGLEPSQIANVEVVGGTTRVPAVLKQLTDFFGREPSRTLNAKETVSRGCALQCAMLSPTFKVSDGGLRAWGSDRAVCTSTGSALLGSPATRGSCLAQASP